VKIKRDGQTVVDTTVTAPAAENGREDPKELIDLIDNRSGNFVVTVSTEDDSVTIDVTKEAGRKEYILLVFISEQGSVTAYTNQDR